VGSKAIEGAALMADNREPSWGGLFPFAGRECPDGPHRGPEGPNEDIGQCGKCGSGTFRMRPPGETFGTHADDCSLPIDHQSFCAPGGSGHPKAERIRG
jgi:hypothetical protein